MGLHVTITAKDGRLFISSCSFLRMMVELKHSDRSWADELWKPRIGWSRVQEWIRKAFPRVRKDYE